jgi:hypothetical protein
MAIDIGDLGSFGKQDFSNIGTMGGPPRKIPLTDEEVEIVYEAKKKFDSLNMDVDSLFEFFNDWQSSKTKSVKRFTISLSFLLTLALIAGVNIIDNELFRVQVSEGREILFSFALLVIHFGSFFYYTYLKSIDLDVHNAKVSTREKSINESVGLMQEIEKIISDNEIPSASYLFKDFTSPILSMHSNEAEVYEALKFYEEKLKKSNKRRKLGEKAEYFLLYILYSSALTAIICSLYG